MGLPWLVWPLGAIAIVASRGKLRLLAIFLALLLFLAIDAMQGNQGVTFELWSRVPFLTLFRFPERFSMLAAMAGASLIGVGLEGIARTIPSAKVRLAASIVILTVAIVDSWTLNVPPYFYRPLAEPETLVRSSGIQDFSGSRNDSGRYFFENFYQSREAPKLVLDTSELPVMDAYEPLLPAVYADVFDAGQGDFWTGRLTVLEVRHPDLKKMYRQQSLRLMDVFGVRYYIDPKSMMEAPNHHLAEAMRDERRIDSTGIRMWERTSALPRAWIVHAARYVPTVKSAVSILRDDSFDPRHEVVLVYGPHSDGISLMDRAAPTTAGDQSRHESKSSVRLEFMKNEDVVVSADTDRPGILILSELWYPGWTATINGDPSEILRANGIFRAVRVPPGHHRVEFRYLPTSHRLGLAATVLGILVLIALLLRPASRRA